MPKRTHRPRRLAGLTALSLGAGLAVIPGMSATAMAACAEQPELGLAAGSLTVQVDSCTFKDLNRDGALQPYEDWRLSESARAVDLVARLSTEEKAGYAFHASLPSGDDGYDLAAVRSLVVDRNITSAITRYATTADELAAAHNSLQEIAELETTWGVPLTISTDPRNGFGGEFGASVAGVDFSKWPEQNGFGAIDDVATTGTFADIARQEYVAVGINMTLSPMADLATDPRWTRTYGTFGSDADLVDRHTRAYIAGFQGGEEGAYDDSIATVVKHWAGYGAPYKGIDGHHTSGRYAVFQNQASLENHMSAFDGAFEVNTAGVMPTYSVLVNAVDPAEDHVDETDDETLVTPLTFDGQPMPIVGGAYNDVLVNQELRQARGYTGVVVSDWGILTSPADTAGGYGQAYGVAELSQSERVGLAMRNGVDQFGGAENPEWVTAAIAEGELAESVLDATVVRVIEQKIRQGLFEDPYVDAAAAPGMVGKPAFQAAALDAQERSLTLLQNTGNLLPLAATGQSIYPLGVDPAAIEAAGFTVAATPETADVALVRIGKTGTYFDMFGGTVHPLDPAVNAAAGNGAEFYTELTQLPATLPRIVTIELDRALVLGEVAAQSTALLANYGISDEALLNVISGEAAPAGRLPYELPVSQAAAEAQLPDVADDSVDPLYPVGFGLAYAAAEVPTGPGTIPAAPGAPAELAATGAETVTPTLIAALLLLLGGAAVVRRRGRGAKS
jgi:beta-glucosidase